MKKIGYIIVLVLIAVAAVVFFTVKKHPMASLPSSKKLSAKEQALLKYPYQLQFKECKGYAALIPKPTLILKQGDQLMLDNQDGKARSFAFKDQSILVAANGFGIMEIKDKGKSSVLCDGAVAATLIVK
jgi:hypothetical protein